MPSARFGEVKLKKVKVKVATQATDCRTDGCENIKSVESLHVIARSNGA